VFVQATLRHLLTRLFDDRKDAFVPAPQFVVRPRTGEFHLAVGVYEMGIHAAAAERKILERANRVDAVQSGCRNLQRAE